MFRLWMKKHTMKKYYTGLSRRKEANVRKKKLPLLGAKGGKGERRERVFNLHMRARVSVCVYIFDRRTSKLQK